MTDPLDSAELGVLQERSTSDFLVAYSDAHEVAQLAADCLAYERPWKRFHLEHAKAHLTAQGLFGVTVWTDGTMFEHALTDFLAMLDMELARLEAEKREAQS